MCFVVRAYFNRILVPDIRNIWQLGQKVILSVFLIYTIQMSVFNSCDCHMIIAKLIELLDKHSNGKIFRFLVCSKSLIPCGIIHKYTIEFTLWNYILHWNSLYIFALRIQKIPCNNSVRCSPGAVINSMWRIPETNWIK